MVQRDQYLVMSPSFHPLVSVIVPFYNGEQYLVETIESVLNQHYKHWELILVDDGSSDGSTAIAKAFADDFPDKIFYFEHDGHANKAAAATRNLGLRKARGELIAFLDADDIWLPNKLHNQVNIFHQNQAVGMVCEASLYWYSWQNKSAKDKEVHVGVAPNKIYKAPELAIAIYPLGTGNAPCPSGIMIKRNVLEKHKGFEESFVGKYQVFEDQAFLSKIYLNEVVYVSADCNNLYRQRADSVMYETQSVGYYDVAKSFYLAWLENYLKEKGITNKMIWFLLWKAFLKYKRPVLSKFVYKLERQYRKIKNLFS